MIKHPQAKFGYEWLSGSEVLFWTNPGAWTDGHSDSSLPVYPQWFRTLWLATKHPHAQFGYNSLSGSEVLFWSNPGAQTDKHCDSSLHAPPPLRKKMLSLTGCLEKSADVPCLEAPPATKGSEDTMMFRASRDEGREKKLMAVLLPLPADTTGRGFCVRISAGCEVATFCRLPLEVSREVEG